MVFFGYFVVFQSLDRVKEDQAGSINPEGSRQKRPNQSGDE
jgi:hypothetical protein